ncbi:hypothetical protein RI054_21g92020 [Pseudoscourfieldia marina]
MPSARSAEGGLFAASSAKRNGVAKLLACTSSQATARGLREATEALEQASTASAASELLMAFRNPAAFEHLMHLQCMVLDSCAFPDANDKRSMRRWAVRLVAAVALPVDTVAWAVRVLQALDLEGELKAEALAEMHARTNAKVADGTDVPEPDSPPLHFSVLLALSRCIGGRISGSDVLELCDDDVARSAWAVLVLMETGANLTDDGRNLVVLGTRLLFSLTTFDAHCGGATEVATNKHLKELTSRFARRNTELLRAVIELDAFESIANAVHPLFSRSDAAEEAHAAARNACRLVHNLLLFSTESSCQLRKSLAHSRFFSAVLDPHLDAVAKSKDMDARPALKALCAITFKVGLLRQHYLTNAPLLASVLETREDDATTVELVCRVACNLGLLHASEDHVACLKVTVEATVAALSAETRASALKRFWIDTATAPVTRGEKTHAWVVSVLGDAEFCKVEVGGWPSEDGLSRRQRRNRVRKQRRQQWIKRSAMSLSDKLVAAATETETRLVHVQPRDIMVSHEHEHDEHDYAMEYEDAGEGWSDFDLNEDVLDELDEDENESEEDL